MIKLQESFISGEGGFSYAPLTYTQLQRTEKTALYQRSRDGKPFDYEVFLIKIDPKGKMIFKKMVEEDTEKYPSNEQFGRIAWSFRHKAAAETMFQKISNPASSVEIEIGTDAETEESSETIAVAEIAPKKETVITVPDIEFSVGELAEQNKIQYPIVFLFVKAEVAKGTIVFVRDERRHAKGRATKIYRKA
jgi:hypothetical protein